jgi:RimJ/RimL family protein N-acetyltransferase
MDPIEQRAKDGRRVRIRPVCVSDAPAILNMQRDVVATGKGAVTTLADLDEGSTLEQLRKRIAELTAQSGAFLLAEWVTTGEPIGTSEIWRMKPSLILHVALMSLQVHPNAQGLGVGRLLLESAINWAIGTGRQDTPRVERLELYVRADNVRARNLYESCGFDVEGVRRRFVRTRDGRYVDDLLMARLLEMPKR